MSLTEYPQIEQGTDEWHDQRRGIVTASVVGALISVGAPDAASVECPTCSAKAESPCLSAARKEPTPIKTIHDARTAKASGLPPVISVANNDTARAVTLSLTAERITGYTEPSFMNDDMMRGHLEEPIARDLYGQHYAPATEIGFMVRDDWGFRIGYSPDGLVGEDGLIEVKSRRQKKQLQTVLIDSVPAENMAQIQCGLLVSGRAWCDYISYSAGMHMWHKRVYPDPRWQTAIVDAVRTFEANAEAMTDTYLRAVEGLPQTVRIDHYALGLEF